MNVKVGQAVKMFFGNSSLEMVYIEAIANSLDANATEINIEISAKAYNQPETLEIKIIDNGVGFTDDRYKKFSNLFDVDESSHKGLGRLVYLCYFESVEINSYYDKTKKREFDFTEGFEENDVKISTIEESESGTILSMKGYTLSKLGKNIFIQPSYLANLILEEFYPRLFQLKRKKKTININIKTTLEDTHQEASLTSDDIPKLELVEIDSTITMFDKFTLYYSIREVEPSESNLISAISIDNRTKKMDIIAPENTPVGYKMVFLLLSDWFIGKVDIARQNLAISETDLQLIHNLFRKNVASIIEKNVPKIAKRNNETKRSILNRYPHLNGFINTDSVGYSSRADVLRKAQDSFFRAQKELLDATTLSDEQFEKSIEMSARALTEYVLFRQLTIEKLKKSSSKNSEAELHKLFVSMKVKFDKKNAVNDIYQNNAWLLDDKYMTYETILSDKEMGELVSYITKEESEADMDRPDIAFIFSNNPSLNMPFDVVIVELKKRGLSLEENMKVVTQLEKRARNLMKYYDNQIQRIWYYGIIEFNEDIELQLSGEYTELYSAGKMYYRETQVAISLNPKRTLPIGIFIWDIDAIIKDADSRNSAFLNLIKSKFTN